MKYLPAAAVIASGLALAAPAPAQVVLNEYNAVSVGNMLQTGGTAKPYEGYDYGVIGSTGTFPADIDSSPGVQTSLPNGFDLITNPQGFGRVDGNGGDWIELVVTEDFVDMRGWTIFWENDDTDFSGNEVFEGDTFIGTHANECGFIKLSNDSAWNNIRQGTIITLSEDDTVPGFAGTPLATDTSFDPSSDDWHMHFHVDESQTDVGIATQYFEGFSDIKVDNDRFRLYIFDSTNTAAQAEAEGPNVVISDLTTGLIQGAVGESAPTYGGSGVNNEEAFASITVTPTSGMDSSGYEDVDFSTFGTENLFNHLTENTLDGVQDFSSLRSWFTTLAVLGDFDNSGTVEGNDLTLLLTYWNQAEATAIADTNWINDDQVDGSGLIDAGELTPLLLNWNTSALSLEDAVALVYAETGLDYGYLVNVPEPGSLALVGLGGLMLLKRRRA